VSPEIVTTTCNAGPRKREGRKHGTNTYQRRLKLKNKIFKENA
jgi:hypothetical protein